VVALLSEIIQKRKMDPMMLEFAMRSCRPQLTYDHFDEADVVIEAVIENIPLKQSIFEALEKIVSRQCILATNTSTIDIDVVAAKLKSRDRVVGLHFFSPAHVMPLLEIIRPKSASPATIAATLLLSKQIGKTPIVVGNCVGFTANRIFFPYGQAAGVLVDLGVDPYRIDKALLAFGMPMGPFQMADLSGVDIGLYVGQIMSKAYAERACSSKLSEILVKAGRLGQKTKVGYYRYEGRSGKPDPTLAPILARVRDEVKQSLPTSSATVNVDKLLTNEQIVEVCLFPVINEATRILQEGHVIRSSDIDLASVMGYGFPNYRGGVMFYGSTVGFGVVVSQLRAFAKQFGDLIPAARSLFSPSPYLVQLSQKQE